MDTRTRSKNTKAFFSHCYHGSPIDYYTYNFTTEVETITSVRGRKRSPLPWNPCEHGKAVLTGCFSGERDPYQAHGLYSTWRGPLGGISVDSIPCPSLLITQETWEQVMDEADLGIQTRVSLPNFLLDCSEMKEGLSRFARKHHAKQPKSLRAENRNVLSHAGGLWLMYSYGIKPFVSDLSAILQTQSRVLEKARAMRSHRGNLCRFQKKVSVANTDEAYATFTPFWRSGWNWKSSSKTSRTGLLMMVYRPRVDADVSEVKLALNSLGVNKVGDVIWDAIPYSFVVDWFVDSQRWVRNLNIDNFQFPCDFLRVGTQLTIKSHTEYTGTDDYGRSIPSHNLIVTAFNRSSGFPGIGSGSIATDRFGARQATYAAALLSNLLR